MSTVDGLVSGLSTSTIISQLMQIEAQPQAKLKSQVSAESSRISAFQAVNSKLTALQTAARPFTSTALPPTTPPGRPVKPPSSPPPAPATATTGAPPGTATFTVSKLAKAEVQTIQL